MNRLRSFACSTSSPTKLNQSQHHDLLLIENKYTRKRCEENEKLKSHFCHTKGNRLKLNKMAKLNFCFTPFCRQIVKGFQWIQSWMNGGWSNCNPIRNFIVLFEKEFHKINSSRLFYSCSIELFFDLISLHLIVWYFICPMLSFVHVKIVWKWAKDTWKGFSIWICY